MFHSFFSDDGKQYAETTAAHSKHLLQFLQQKNILRTTRSTIWDNTDGCVDQYRCATVLYSLSMLSHAHEIIIYRGVGVTGHGKYSVGGLDANDKNYLSILMKTVQIPNTTTKNSQMVMHTSTENADISLAK